MATTRRLAAIMFTDTVGYTASAQADEAHALELLRQQAELVRPLIRAHHGREIKSTGDGFLVEFDSALRATQCAVDIQRRMYERNAEGGVTPIQIRIGIHLGDVEQRGADILGDAVNIAARIEPVAEPGGVCLSGAVREQVWNKIPDKLERIPPTALKGLQISMDLYRVVLPATVREPSGKRDGPIGLAVLPFSNISSDPKDEYFADGLTEELITVLSQLRNLRVIARTSVMPLKSTAKGLFQIGAELRVSWVLEGSVRKAGNRLRVTVQLIDVASEDHVWVHTYDRELDDVFAVQADLATQVAEALKIETRSAEVARLESRRVVRPDSYLAYLRGRTLLHSLSRASWEDAKKNFELAISLDANNAPAYSSLAYVTHRMGWVDQGLPQAKWSEMSRSLVARAIALDPNLAEAHASLGTILWDDFEYRAAEKELKLALALNPSDAVAHGSYGALLEDEGRADEAVTELSLAVSADPYEATNYRQLAYLLVWLGRLDEALVKIQRFGELEPGPDYHAVLATYHLARSDLKGCLQEMARLEESEPGPREKAIIRAWSHALSGEGEQARALLRQEEILPELPRVDSALAQAYAELGDLDECFRTLEKIVAYRFIWFQPWRLDPRLEHVRRDPRFQGLLRRMNLA